MPVACIRLKNNSRILEQGKSRISKINWLTYPIGVPCTRDGLMDETVQCSEAYRSNGNRTILQIIPYSVNGARRLWLDPNAGKADLPGWRSHGRSSFLEDLIKVDRGSDKFHMRRDMSREVI